MRITAWTPVTAKEEIPFFGEELIKHFNEYAGIRKIYSLSAWNLLYDTLTKNKLPISDVYFNADGKPYFTDNQLYFSLSHCNGFCAVAVSDRPVGIDIENAARNIPDKVLRRVLSSDEYGLYSKTPVLGWCRKEAVTKLRGRGIILDSGLDTIDYDNYVFFDYLINRKQIDYRIVSCFLK